MCKRSLTSTAGRPTWCSSAPDTTLIHSQHFQLALHPDRRLEVTTSAGVPVLHHPAQPWGDPAQLARGRGRLVSAETLPPDRVEPRIDLGYIVSVLVQQSA